MSSAEKQTLRKPFMYAKKVFALYSPGNYSGPIVTSPKEIVYIIDEEGQVLRSENGSEFKIIYGKKEGK